MTEPLWASITRGSAASAEATRKNNAKMTLMGTHSTSTSRRLKMRRILRHFWLAVSIVSLLLCAATIWLWVRSYRGPDYVEYGGKDRMLVKVISGHGTLDFLVIPRWPQWEEFRVDR